MAGRSVLILTQPPFEGGVPAKTRILCRHLRALGHEVRVAWYATFAHDPDLNVPSWRLGRGWPASRAQTCFGDFPGIAVGAFLPELEAPYYIPNGEWRRLIAAHDRHIAVGGPPLVGNLLATTGTPGLLWCASDLESDRKDRVAAMGLGRRLVHDLVTRPWVRAQQSRVLGTLGRVMGVSSYTIGQLQAHGCPAERLRRLPIPVDTSVFVPPAVPLPSGVLGFAARFEDPRKNLPLALESLACLRRDGADLRLRLAGARPSDSTLARVRDLGLEGAVEFVGELGLDQLPAFYAGLDLFVLPSHQEGLCIAGLEAMACGVPVISTRCGGPEDYVRDGETGYLCDGTPPSMAAAISRALPERRRLGEGARLVAESEFSHTAFAAGLAESWRAVWGDLP
ncbi:glycosyltransferase [Paramagnetospirillum caucaseum]|uniref:Glycosyltransferase n=1 Tax=Paramagnetospirillum caucaseum TaxID=1244869 RepID=M3A976_9PROT|nr:glycosyltransferase [Paramagnetospirillum caucaseum]EME69338.1 glycosyltransferase [Paramagnetospirillum caucaseum]